MRWFHAALCGAAAFACVLHSSADVAPAADAELRAASAQADGAIASIEATSQRMRSLLRRSRERGSTEQIACANEGLSRVDVALRNAREHARLTREAAARGDVPATRREVVVLSVLQRSARSAAGAADSCWSEASMHDDTSVRVVAGSR